MYGLLKNILGQGYVWFLGWYFKGGMLKTYFKSLYALTLVKSIKGKLQY